MGSAKAQFGLRKNVGFTLIELLVVVAIIVVLISVLLPGLSKAREQSKTVSCQANLHSIMQASTIYVSEYQDRLPNGRSFSWETSTSYTKIVGSLYAHDLLKAVMSSNTVNSGSTTGVTKVFRCPGRGENSPTQTWLNSVVYPHYRFNVDYAPNTRTVNIRSQSAAVVFYDVIWSSWNYFDYPHNAAAQSGALINAGYADGHVESKRYSTMVIEFPAALSGAEYSTKFIKNGWKTE